MGTRRQRSPAITEKQENADLSHDYGNTLGVTPNMGTPYTSVPVICRNPGDQDGAMKREVQILSHASASGDELSRSLDLAIDFSKERYRAREAVPGALCPWCESRGVQLQLGAKSGYAERVELPTSSAACGTCQIFRWAIHWLSEGDQPEGDYFILDLDANDSYFTLSQYRGESRCWERDDRIREMHLFRTDSCKSFPSHV